MSTLDWVGTGPVQARQLDEAGGYEFVLPHVTSQAKVYKQSLRDFFRQQFPLSPRAGEFQIDITISLNPNFPAIDLDNVAKAVLDGLKGHVFHDDAQVMRLLVEKKWADGEEVRVRVREVV
jgi:crossover junction endodeoxyribonuclease RusA